VSAIVDIVSLSRKVSTKSDQAQFALTGVSVSFCPLSLYQLGRDGVDITDWRVLTDFAVIFLVPGVFMSFGAPVIALAGKRSRDSAFGADDGGRRRSAKGGWLFFVFAVIGVVIWVVSGWFVK
jgi:hypothetical protein